MGGGVTKIHPAKIFIRYERLPVDMVERLPPLKLYGKSNVRRGPC